MQLDNQTSKVIKRKNKSFSKINTTNIDKN